MTLLSSGALIDPARSYVVAGWASVDEKPQGPPIWDVVERHIGRTISGATGGGVIPE